MLPTLTPPLDEDEEEELSGPEDPDEEAHEIKPKPSVRKHNNVVGLGVYSLHALELEELVSLLEDELSDATMLVRRSYSLMYWWPLTRRLLARSA